MEQVPSRRYHPPIPSWPEFHVKRRRLGPGVMAIQGGCSADSPVVSVTRIESEADSPAEADASVAFHLTSSPTCRHRCQCR